MGRVDLSKYGITGTTEIVHNPSFEVLFEEDYKMRLPCDFHNEANRHARVCIRAAERVHYEQPLARQLFEGNVLTSIPCFLGSGMLQAASRSLSIRGTAER